MAPRILLLHATAMAMDPIQAAFSERWHEAETINVLDDSLSLDRAKEQGPISEKMIERFVRFGLHGYDETMSGVLATCSAFGAAIDRLSQSVSVPVLKPNEAMFRSALGLGECIGMLVTFAPAVGPMTEEFDDFIRENNKSVRLRTVVVDEAMARLRAGDGEGHDRLLAARATELSGCDAIMLAQFSNARAAQAVRAAVSKPVLTAPEAAVDRMRALVEKRES